MFCLQIGSGWAMVLTIATGMNASMIHLIGKIELCCLEGDTIVVGKYSRLCGPQFCTCGFMVLVRCWLRCWLGSGLPRRVKLIKRIVDSRLNPIIWLFDWHVWLSWLFEFARGGGNPPVSSLIFRVSRERLLRSLRGNERNVLMNFWKGVLVDKGSV